jgi:hypothetical protein
LNKNINWEFDSHSAYFDSESVETKRQITAIADLYHSLFIQEDPYVNGFRKPLDKMSDKQKALVALLDDEMFNLPVSTELMETFRKLLEKE